MSINARREKQMKRTKLRQKPMEKYFDCQKEKFEIKTLKLDVFQITI